MQYQLGEVVRSKFVCGLLFYVCGVGSGCEIDDGADGVMFYDPSTLVAPYTANLVG